jgi:hypothetical protein
MHECEGTIKAIASRWRWSLDEVRGRTGSVAASVRPEAVAGHPLREATRWLLRPRSRHATARHRAAACGREQQRGVGCADCCSAEPGRRVVPGRPFAECRGAEAEQARGRRDACPCSARRSTGRGCLSRRRGGPGRGRLLRRRAGAAVPRRPRHCWCSSRPAQSARTRASPGVSRSIGAVPNTAGVPTGRNYSADDIPAAGDAPAPAQKELCGAPHNSLHVVRPVMLSQPEQPPRFPCSARD